MSTCVQEAKKIPDIAHFLFVVLMYVRQAVFDSGQKIRALGSNDEIRVFCNRPYFGLWEALNSCLIHSPPISGDVRLNEADAKQAISQQRFVEELLEQWPFLRQN